MTVERRVLPSRPLGLRFGFYLRRAGLGLLLLAMVTGTGAATAWAISSAWNIRRDQRVWDGGTPAADGLVQGKVQSRGLGWVIAFYDLEVTYTDAEGARYRGPVTIETMLGKVDTDAAPEVRYDPADHDRFALSWAVAASGARWRWVVIGGAFFGGLTVLLLWGALAFVKDAAAIRRCARTGREVIVKVAEERLLDDSKGRRSSKCRYTLLVPAADGGEEQWIAELDLSRASPLFADPTRGSAYALIGSGPKARILVRDDLYPLAVTAAERTATRERASA